jgi:hypothetical protein
MTINLHRFGCTRIRRDWRALASDKGGFVVKGPRGGQSPIFSRWFGNLDAISKSISEIHLPRVLKYQLILLFFFASTPPLAQR